MLGESARLVDGVDGVDVQAESQSAQAAARLLAQEAEVKTLKNSLDQVGAPRRTFSTRLRCSLCRSRVGADCAIRSTPALESQ